LEGVLSWPLRLRVSDICHGVGWELCCAIERGGECGKGFFDQIG
jgi:hypothetical protein